MAMQTSNPVTPISSQVIGNVFVEQYYHVLQHAPDHIHKFYKDSSILNRPDSNGSMTSVTTVHDINEKLLSADFTNSVIEIETTDAQLSHKDGVLVVVIGTLTTSDNIRRKFTQLFFLAPQENGGYFVLNDLFRFITEMQSVEMSQVALNQAKDSTKNAPSTPEPEPIPDKACAISDLPAIEHDANNGGDVINPSVNDNCRKENISVDQSIQLVKDESIKATQTTPAPTSAQKDMTKKSYASIVKIMREIPQPMQLIKPKQAPKPMAKVVESVDKSVLASAKPIHTADTRPLSDSNVSKDNNLDEQGYSIFVRNLPWNATSEVVEEVFKKFGTIKKGGIQVRNHKIYHLCIGFIEYESSKSMQAAIKASPISFAGRNAIVEEKRTITRVVNGVFTHGDMRSRLQSERGAARGGFNFRGRGGRFGSVSSYNRNYIRNHNEYNYSGYSGGRGRGVEPGSRYN